MKNTTKTDLLPSDMRFLDTRDLQDLFGVGRSKARLMMDAPPSVRVGGKDYISATKLAEYLDRHGGISVRWPNRKR